MFTVKRSFSPIRTSDVVQLGHGDARFPVPRVGVIEVNMDDRPEPIYLDVELIDGRYRCVGIRSEGGLSGELLRLLPLTSLIRQGVTSFGVFTIPGLNQPASEITKDGPTDEALKNAAALYQFALILGDPPTKTVAARLEMGYSTAARWIALARERGFLGKTRQGKADA